PKRRIWLRAAILSLFAASDLVLPGTAAKSAETPDRPEPRTMLAQPEQLQRTLKERGLRVLDARPHSDYLKAHIPGAVWVDVKAWQDLGKRDGGFHDARAWADKVGRLGISKDARVVVYGSSLPDAARIWWTLRYLGLGNVTLLDGGWELWSRQGRPTD